MFARAKTVSSERNVYIMKATGIVRRIDDLGRVVIPKEIRRTMRIREGDPLEIFTDREGEVIFKKYIPSGSGKFVVFCRDRLHLRECKNSLKELLSELKVVTLAETTNQLAIKRVSSVLVGC